MSSKKNPHLVGGPNGISFEEYIRRVEQYLACEDPPTILRSRLGTQVCTYGVSSLSADEKTYYAIDLFLAVLMDGDLKDFIQEAGDDQRNATKEGLSRLGFDDQVASFESLFELPDSRFDDDAETGAVFTGMICDLDMALEQFASDRGLHLTT